MTRQRRQLAGRAPRARRAGRDVRGVDGCIQRNLQTAGGGRCSTRSNGADVVVVEPSGANVGPKGAAQLARISGVRTVEPLQHRFAYIGSDLQDLYGVDPATIVKNAQLRDSFFKGGTAKKLFATLAAKPDAILVSQGARDRLPAAARRPSQPAPEGPTTPER